MSRFKLVLFDMDGTLLKKRSIFVFSEKKGFKAKLVKIMMSEMEPYQKSVEIAGLLQGFEVPELLDIFRNIPLQDDVEEVLDGLKRNLVKTAVVTDSYQFLADDLKNRLGLNYAFANYLEIRNNVITGRLVAHNKGMRKDFINNKVYSICKEEVLENLCDDLKISVEEAIAVGDGDIDAGMVKKAGLGVAFNGSSLLKKHADVCTNTLKTVLQYVKMS